jgi:hypothetical protein
MTAVSDVVHTDYAANPRVYRGPEEAGGVVQFCRFSYEASALESGSTISIGVPVPKGARLVDIVVLADDLGTTAGTLEVGDSGDTDRFLAAYATGSATFKSFVANGRIDNMHYEFPSDTQLLITTAGAAITGTIKGHFLYVLV